MRRGRHDRHGRAARADNDRRRRPSDGFRTVHGARFSDLVEDAIAALPGPLLEGMSGVEVVIEDVPPVDTEAFTTGEVPLARLREAPEGRWLVVYRRPLELRSSSRSELIEVTRTAIGVEVARALGIEDDLDDLFGPEP